MYKIFPLLLTYTNDAMTLTGKEYQIILIAFALNINYIKNVTYTTLTKIMKAISNNQTREKEWNSSIANGIEEIEKEYSTK